MAGPRENERFATWSIGNLRAGGSRNEYPAKFLDVVAEVAVVANIDGIALAAFDILCDLLAADARSDRLLHVGNR